jgi:ribosome-binding protein aMBF1 (putative translation factor)
MPLDNNSIRCRLLIQQHRLLYSMVLQQIVFRRHKLGLSQAELGNLLDIDELFIKAVEREEEAKFVRGSDVFDAFIKLCRFFNLEGDLNKLDASLKKIIDYRCN